MPLYIATIELSSYKLKPSIKSPLKLLSSQLIFNKENTIVFLCNISAQLLKLSYCL